MLLEDKQWRVVVGDKQWPSCQTLGRLLSSPSGKTWASTAKVDGKFVMMVNGVASQAYAEIQHGESLFPAGDERVVFAATTLADSKTPARVIVDGKEGKAYAQVRGDSILFSPNKTAMAYVAGDGNKNFVVVDGKEGSAFDGVDDLRFSSKSVLAYRARRGTEYFVVVGDKTWGPYADVKPKSLVFSPDGKVAAWAAFGAAGNWQVLADGKPIDSGCDRVVSQLTFGPRRLGAGLRRPLHLRRQDSLCPVVQRQAQQRIQIDLDGGWRQALRSRRRRHHLLRQERSLVVPVGGGSEMRSRDNSKKAAPDLQVWGELSAATKKAKSHVRMIRGTNHGAAATLKTILAAAFILLSAQIQAAEPTPPVKGLKCVFLAPRVPAPFESSLVGSQKRLPAIAEKAGISGHSQVELTLDRDDTKRAAEITAALSGGPIDLLALTVSAKGNKGQR